MQSWYHFWSEECSCTTKQLSRYQLGVMWFNSILILSTQRQLQIPQVKFQSYKTAFPPSSWPSVSLESWLLPVHLTGGLQWGVPTTRSLNFRCQLQVQVVFYLYFWSTDSKTEVPKIPFLDSSVAHRTKKHFTHQIICLLWQDITGK